MWYALSMSTQLQLHLTSQQRKQLDKLIRSGVGPARTLTKARILRLTDHSQGRHRTDADIASALGVSLPTIWRVRKRCAEEGLEAALHDRARSGRPPKITGDIEARITVLACSDPPPGHAKWSLRLLADKAVELGYLDSISHMAIAKRLKKLAAALASEILVYRDALRSLCRQDGGRAGGLSSPL
jgi:putative transposase